MAFKISRVYGTKPQAKENYDRISRWYDRFSADSEGPFISRAIANMEIIPGESVLEVGCGTGRGLSALGEKVGIDGRVYGIE